MAASSQSLTSARHTRLRVAALLYFGSRILLAAFLMAVPVAYLVLGWTDWRVAAAAGVAVGLTFLVTYLVARPLRCGACGQPSLRHSGKVKHAYASKWMGLSCRARVAWDVMTAQDHFCMYCHSRIRHRSMRPTDEGLKLPPLAAKPGDSPLGALSAGPTAGLGHATIFDAALLAGETDSKVASSAPIPAARSSPAFAVESSPALAPAGPLPHLSILVPVQPLPAMTSPVPFPPIAPTAAPVLPPAIPTAATTIPASPFGPPPLLATTAPVLPPFTSAPPVVAEVLKTTPPLTPSLIQTGENPFVKKPAVVSEPPAVQLPAKVAPAGFGLPGAVVPESICRPGETMPSPLHMGPVISPVGPPVPKAPDVLPQSMEAVLAALQQGQETLGAAFQTVINQLRAVMDQIAVAPQPPVHSLPVPPPTVVPIATPATPAATAPLPAPPSLTAPEAALPLAPPPQAPELVAWSPPPPPAPPEVVVRPAPLTTVSVPAAAPTLPVRPLPAPPPVSPLSPPPIAPPGLRVYPPLHPVIPTVPLPPPHALTAPVNLPVAVKPMAAPEIPSHEVKLASAPVDTPAPGAGVTQEPPPPIRRRPLPNLPKTVFEELGPTLAQAFAPSGAVDPMENPGLHPPFLLPVQPLTPPTPFPTLPVPPPAPAVAQGTTGGIPPQNSSPSFPTPGMPPVGLALPSLEVPPGNSFMPVPPAGGTHPLPPAVPEADPDHPPVPAPFSFLKPAPPPEWPADDLPALPLSEEPPMWTRTRGKTSLS